MSRTGSGDLGVERLATGAGWGERGEGRASTSGVGRPMVHPNDELSSKCGHPAHAATAPPAAVLPSPAMPSGRT